MSKYKELYPQTLSDGVGLISTLSSLNVPWAAMNIPSIERMYGVRSGFKTIVDSFVEIPAELRASVLYSMFNEKWTKLWNIYNLEYNPLTAYRVLETGSNEETEQVSNDSTSTETVDTTSQQDNTLQESGSNEEINQQLDTSNSTEKNNESVQRAITIDNGNYNTDENSDSVWGFNSSEPVSSDYSNSKDTSTSRNSEIGNVNTQSSRELNSESDTQKEVSVSHSVSREGNGEYVGQSSSEAHSETNNQKELSSTHTLTKEGNIGYSTPQKLLREEFELWAIPFFQKVFDDIDSFITIMVY